MEAVELKTEIREITGKHVKYLRHKGIVPAVMYGREVESTLLQINAKSLTAVLSQAGTHQLISLQIGDKEPMMTLARDIKRDPIKHNYLHVDFYAVKMDEKVTSHVPILFEGESPAVKDIGGILTQSLASLEVECLPKDLIASITVNLDGLVNFNDTVMVADLSVPDSITILSDPDSMVVKIEAPRTSEELELSEGEEETEGLSSEPEVLTAAKEEE